MAVVFSEFVQLGALAPFYRRFEESLVKMAEHIGSPAPQLKGGQIHHVGQAVTWLVVCTVERPSAADLVCDAVESDLESGLLRVMQVTIARLAHVFRGEFEGTPYSFFGGRDEQDRPAGGLVECAIARQFQHMEGQLYDTQVILDRLRQDYNIRGREIATQAWPRAGPRLGVVWPPCGPPPALLLASSIF